jgi:hypothetical protein
MKIIVTAYELIDSGYWENYCDKHGINEWSVNEGLMDSDEELVLSEEEARDYGFIKEE